MNSKRTRDEIGESAHVASHYIRSRTWMDFKTKYDERRF